MSTVKLQGSDGQIIEVSRAVIEISLSVKNCLDVTGDDQEPVPLPNVTGNVVRKVIQFCEHRHSNPPEPKEEDDFDKDDDDDDEKEQDREWELTDWELDYLKVPINEIYDIIMAANYMDIQELIDLGCKGLAYLMRGKTAEEMREMFNIANDWPMAKKAEAKDAEEDN